VAIIHRVRKSGPASSEEVVEELRSFAQDDNMEIKLLLNRVERDAGSIADTMKKIHGGKWTVSVNHENCFVIVSQDFS